MLFGPYLQGWDEPELRAVPAARPGVGVGPSAIADGGRGLLALKGDAPRGAALARIFGDAVRPRVARAEREGRESRMRGVCVVGCPWGGHRHRYVCMASARGAVSVCARSVIWRGVRSRCPVSRMHNHKGADPKLCGGRRYTQTTPPSLKA